MIKALMCVYNEENNIKKAVESIVNYVDYVLVFDGKYSDFPGDNIESTDKTIKIINELIKKYTNILFFPAEKYNNQQEKRNRMFKEMKKGEIAFIFDGDEWCANPEEIRRVENIDFNIMWGYSKSNLYLKPYITPRFIRYWNGVHYYGRHSYLVTARNKLICSHQWFNNEFKTNFSNVIIWNLRHINGIEREKNKKLYRKNRNISENKVTEIDLVKDKILLPVPDRAEIPRKVVEILKYYKKKIDYSIVIPFSRPWAVYPWFQNFDKTKLPEGTFEIILIVDHNQAEFYETVKEKLLFRKDRFEQIKIFMTGNEKLPCYKNVAKRRDRIIDNWNLFLTEISGDMIFGFEDDTLPEPDAYLKLLEIMKNEDCDFIQGTEVGRWNAKIIPHWKIIEENGKIVEISSAYFGDRYYFYNNVVQFNVIPIDGGGWYCFIGKTDVFRKSTFQHFIDPPLGPDLYFCWELKQKGYKCLADWNTKCYHISETEKYHQDETRLHYITRKRMVDGTWKEDIEDIENREE